ncbi:MAG: group II intron reverse transcriptase/maturase [Deltaproteobacteria bacterium]|nr:group II intron reverse transcriptase/maturase [Deltaproteobacteria bacterium]
MPSASTPEHMSPGLVKVAERAKAEPTARFHSLAHLIDEGALRRAYDRIRKDAAVGVDGITKEDYGQDVEVKLHDLHQRLVTKRYRHQPIRRVHIPKGRDQTRPIGISCVEDKIVQDALREVLDAVYEQDFLECSYGFRRKRRAHDALTVLDRAAIRGEANWVIEADIVSFFDSIDRAELVKMLELRVPDGSLHRLIGKCLHVGVLDGDSFTTPDVGTAQGSVLSPLLGNVYLHYALDLWLEHEVKPRLRGKATLVRYADDFVIGFQLRDDAERVMMVLPKRMQRFGLTLHPDKTRIFDFRRPPRGQDGGKGPSTFDFLGFTLFWRRSRNGVWSVGCKTRRARLARAIMAAYDWCRSHRHEPIKEQHVALKRRIQGHMNYFGIRGNMRSLDRLVYHVKRAWLKWLNRRSQHGGMGWDRFQDLLLDYPLPRPRVMVASNWVAWSP